MRTLCLLGLLCATTTFAQTKAKVRHYYLDIDFVVSQAGLGDFETIQEAINAVPPLRKKRTRIMIENGIYKEKLLLPPTATDVTFIGQDVNQTIITFDDFASRKNIFGEEMGTSSSSTFFIFGDGFEAQNITFENSAGPVGQAVAVRVDGDRVKFENCRFLGFQDTLYPHGKNSRQYYKNCYIEGTIDFIFGWSTAVFDSCRIFCKAEGFVTAASTEEQTKFGFVFRNCSISGSAPAGSVFLGRPWRPFAKVVYLNCQLDAVIHPAGWDNWSNADNERTAYFAEYGSTGPGAAPEKRTSWSYTISASDSEYYSLDNIFGEWNPLKNE
ncbi:MAG TPA: pectinesterase family protein [Saprospiraceae bacterium]|nr:pectinesterase family protein [Saprospiraceae bacterium]